MKTTTLLFSFVVLSLMDSFIIGYKPAFPHRHRLVSPPRSAATNTITTTRLYDSLMSEDPSFSDDEMGSSKADSLPLQAADSSSSAQQIRAFGSEIPDFNAGDKLELRQDKMLVGNPQLVVDEKDMTVTDILRELAAIRQEGPQKYCILGTRHCSYLHQQIIELLAYALVLSGNHVFTSGAQGTNAAAVRGALRADDQELITVVLPQSFEKQTSESQELLEKVENIIAFPEHDELSLEVASKLCNSFLLNQTDQLISFAFHESNTIIETVDEAKENKKLVTMLFLD